MQMIEEGYDVGVFAGRLHDERVVAHHAGTIARSIVAAPALIKRLGAPQSPGDLERFPWASLSGSQFGAGRQLSVTAANQTPQTPALTPRLCAEGVTSMRQAALAGVILAVLPHWLVHEDLRRKRLVRVLPAWNVPPLPLQVVHSAERRLPLRVHAFVEFAIAHMRRSSEGHPSLTECRRPRIGRRRRAAPA